MARRFKIIAASAAAAAFAGLAVPALAGVPGGDGVLTELPAHPPAGTCYARVKVLSDDRGPPPGERAVWKETPALPGAVGPTWCLVLEPGYAPPPPPERFGWVRVLCDTDATPTKIRYLQSKLRAHGDYTGEESGRYDQATADAVARFQQDQHIDHGGYLSLRTVDAIEHAEIRESVVATGATLPPIHVTGCCKPPPPPERIPVPYPVRVEVKVPVPYPVEVKVPVPYEVKVPVRVEVPVPQPYPVRVEVPVPQPYPVKVPVRVEVPVPQPYPVYVPQPQPPQPCCFQPPPPVQPCCVAPLPPQPCCGGGGYYPGRPPIPTGHDRDGFLSWPGKSSF